MLAVANVALRRFLRERSNFFFVFILPFLIILLVGYSSGARTSAPLAVVGANTDIGAAVLTHLPAERIESFEDLSDATQAVGDTDASALVVFSKNNDDPINFYARTGTALDVRAELDAAIAMENQRIVIARQAEIAGVNSTDVAAAQANLTATAVKTDSVGTVVWGGLDDLDASSLTQVVLFMFLSALTASSFLVQDRTLGMATRKASAPISITRLVLGETLGRFWISMFQALLIVLVSGLFFDVNWGNPVATGMVLVLFGLVSTGFGILLGTAFDNPEAANGVGITVGLVLAALGGAMAPVEIFPETMQTIAKLTPHFWAINGLQVSLTEGTAADLIQPTAILAVTAVVVLGISTVLFRRRTFASR